VQRYAWRLGQQLVHAKLYRHRSIQRHQGTICPTCKLVNTI
jgi:hypothetical protein